MIKMLDSSNAESIYLHLRQKAREDKRPFDELLQYYAIERYIYRLSKSPYREKFILKGALLFTVWQVPRSRATKDIDLLGLVHNDIDKIVEIAKELCTQNVEPDGMVYDPESVVGEPIDEDAKYKGIRVTFKGNLFTSRAKMQIDIAFGDPVTAEPPLIRYPTILNLPAPHLKGYPIETVVAEKFEAMVTLALINSRMKDFFDLWLLSRQFDFDGRKLAKAIEQTFAKRRRTISPLPVCLTDEFGKDPIKQTQWNAFVRKSRLEDHAGSLKEVIDALRIFLLPLAEALSRGEAFQGTWKAPGPWKRTA